MKTRGRILLTLAVVVLCSLAAVAQPTPQSKPQPKQRLSPHETISAVIDGNRITVVYGRPYTKDPHTGEVRKIWGGLVPYGKVWRAGADEATLLITQQPIMLGDLSLPAGAYTLWVLPTSEKTQLIVNRQIGQWGMNSRDPKAVYDEANDVGRTKLKEQTTAEPVDQFTISIVPNATSGGTSSGTPSATSGGILTLEWENTRFSAPIVVKNAAKK